MKHTLGCELNTQVAGDHAYCECPCHHDLPAIPPSRTRRPLETLAFTYKAKRLPGPPPDISVRVYFPDGGSEELAQMFRHRAPAEAFEWFQGKGETSEFHGDNGISDLALSILTDYFARIGKKNPGYWANTFYMHFKYDLLSVQPEEGFELTGGQVTEWVRCWEQK
jgi:hypothetical protein